MGYRTRFEGSVTGPSELVEEFDEWVGTGHATFGSYGADPTGFIDGYFGDDMSWYEHEKEVAELSADFPALLFYLRGEGEEAGDVWELWARNGKTVKVQAELTFREVDFDKELPNPEQDEELRRVRSALRAEIKAEIDRLNAELEAL